MTSLTAKQFQSPGFSRIISRLRALQGSNKGLRCNLHTNPSALNPKSPQFLQANSMGTSHFWISASSTSRAVGQVWAGQDLIPTTISKAGVSQHGFMQRPAWLPSSRHTYGSPGRCCRKGTPYSGSDMQDDFSALVCAFLFNSRGIWNIKRGFFPGCSAEPFSNNALHNLRMQSEELCLGSQRIFGLLLQCYYVPYVLQWRIFELKKDKLTQNFFSCEQII